MKIQQLKIPIRSLSRITSWKKTLAMLVIFILIGNNALALTSGAVLNFNEFNGYVLSGTNTNKAWENSTDVTIVNKILSGGIDADSNSVAKKSNTLSPPPAYTAIPDANFEQVLFNAGIDAINGDHQVLTSAISGVTTLNVNDGPISDLTGIRDFTSLQYLNCFNSNITFLDVTGLTNLQSINSYQDYFLTNVILTGCTALNNINFGGCPLTTISFAGLTAMSTIDMNSFNISELDLSSCHNLTYIQIYSEALQKLNLSGLTNMSNLQMYLGGGNITCIQVDDVATANQLSYSDPGNWWSMTQWNKPAGASYSTNCNFSPPLSYTAIPDTNFEQALFDQGIDTVNGDHRVLTSAISVVTNLNLAYYNISDLAGIEGFTALTTLDCSGNSLISLDLSANTALTYLACSGNTLTSLNLSANTALTTLNCPGNTLTSLNLSANTALTELACYYNSLSSLDVSANTALTYLDCSTNSALACITVSDVAAANANGSWNKDATASYALSCNSTWSGAVDTAWENANNWSPTEVPPSYVAVTIAPAVNQPIIGSDVIIKKLTVNTTASLLVNSNTNLTVVDAMTNNGTVTFENNANLIQQGTTNTNSGNIVIKRNSSALMRFDYTLWSSPVVNQKLLDFSPATLATRFYTYNTTTNKYNVVASPSITNFATADGYLIRMPDTHPATPTVWNGIFTGVPNNGDIPYTMTDGGAGFRFNLVGNPYPSPINMAQFVTDNTSITGTLYFWRKTNNPLSPSYCTWTAGIFTTNGEAQVVNPAGIIQTGQGFIVEANGTGTNLVFNNNQRVANNTGQFFKTKQTVENNRIWLNATNTLGAFSQMAVGYSTGATQGVDSFDGKYYNDGAIALSSILNNTDYVIQGRALPFDATDVVPMSFSAKTAGDYTIAIDHVDGIFSGSQAVILVDNATGIETDLKTTSYTFSTSAGMDTTRFSLKYQKTLGINNPSFDENNVTIFKNKGLISIKSSLESIANVKVFDINGRLLFEKSKVNANETNIDSSKFANQVLIVKITSENNKIVNKKVIN